MDGYCNNCGSLCCYECWIETKVQMPPLYEVIEGVSPKGWEYSSLRRDYFALIETNNELQWITPGLNPYEYSDFRISHWRRIPPDPKGKKPFIKITKRKGYWDAKVIFLKIDYYE